MPTFVTTVRDRNTNAPIVGATLAFLDTNLSPLMVNGEAVTIPTDGNGTVTWASGAAAVNVRVMATTYASQNVVLQPGQNDVYLNGTVGPEATITATRSFYNKNKALVWLLLAFAAVFIAVKYNLIKL